MKTSDPNLGYIAHRALGSGYQTVLASHGIEYPVSDRDGHDLDRLVELIRGSIGTSLLDDIDKHGSPLNASDDAVRPGILRVTAAGHPGTQRLASHTRPGWLRKPPRVPRRAPATARFPAGPRRQPARRDAPECARQHRHE